MNVSEQEEEEDRDTMCVSLSGLMISTDEEAHPVCKKKPAPASRCHAAAC